MAAFKITSAFLVCLVSCFSIADASTSPAPTGDTMVTVPGTNLQCLSKYYDIDHNHTMCQQDVGTAIPLTDGDKKLAVERHNQIRAEVDPKSSDMMEMVWDDDLAVVAGKWAKQCTPGHDTGHRNEPKFPGTKIGQNAARGYSTLLEAINEGWYAEKENFTYGVDTGDKINGHYKQLIFANSTRVGCGMADCTGHSHYPRFQVCNYAPALVYVHHQGEVINPEYVPYKNSTTACSDCNSHCNADGNLCDCGGKVCYNDGLLDLQTCNCVCSRIFTGPLCETKHCPADIGWKCDYYWTNLQDPCHFSNVRTEDCPHKCGFC